MYGHQVIAAMRGLAQEVKAKDPIYADNALYVADKIPTAQRIYLGVRQELMARFSGQFDGMIPFLDPEVSEGIRPPYTNCWFDYSDNTTRGLSEGQSPVPRRGLLVCQVPIDPDLMQVWVCNYYPTAGWVLGPLTYLISIGKKLKDVARWPAGEPRLEWWEEGNLFPLPTSLRLIGIMEERGVGLQQLIIEDQADRWCLNIGLLLLNAKNVGTQRVDPSPKLNKSRLKKGKLPQFSYYILTIRPIGKRQESIPLHLWDNRLHLCRGHFKTYSAERPLFGSITGRFWWQAHTRGSADAGVIVKDYKVECRNGGGD